MMMVTLKQSAFLVFWDLIPIYLSRNAGTGVHNRGTAPLTLGNGGHRCPYIKAS